MDVRSAFHSLDLTLSPRRFSTSFKFFGIKKLPRSPILDGDGSVVVVFADAAVQVFRVTDIESARRVALQNIEIVGH